MKRSGSYEGDSKSWKYGAGFGYGTFFECSCICCGRISMSVLLALIAFALSAGTGITLSFFNQGMGVVASVSIIGAFVVYILSDKNNKS